MAKHKWVWTLLGIVGIVGGAVHVLSSLNINILSSIPYPRTIQFIAGAGGITYIIKKLM